MKITKEWLKKNGACSEVTEWFNGQSETDAKKVLLELMKHNHFDWANWTIVRLMTNEQKIKYAIFAAEKVLSIYESKCPENKAPRNAIKAAKAYLKNPSDKNKNAAYSAARAAEAADYLEVYAAACAAEAAARAAEAAAYSAVYAAGTRAASAAAYSAVYAAVYAAGTRAAAEAASDKLKRSIINYGIKLIGEIK